MKKLLFFSLAFMFFSFLSVDNTLTKKERKFAVDLLKDTQNGIESTVKGLSEDQLNFKPAPDRWSVSECLKHIAMSEQMLRGMLDGGLKQPANPDKRSEIKMTDEQIIKNFEDRTNKVKTMDALKPENTPFKSTEDAHSSFKENREKLISYVSDTKDDLRGHVLTMPFGSVDAYQIVLFIAAHSNRHMQQMKEVMADPNFPK